MKRAFLVGAMLLLSLTVAGTAHADHNHHRHHHHHHGYQGCAPLVQHYSYRSYGVPYGAYGYGVSRGVFPGYGVHPGVNPFPFGVSSGYYQQYQPIYPGYGSSFGRSGISFRIGF